MPSVDRFPLSRRRLCLGVAGSLSLSGLAGCLGSSRETITLGAGPAESRTYHAGQALAFALAQHSDSVELVVRETDGWNDNLYRYDDGTVSAVGVGNTVLYRAMTDRVPFDFTPVSAVPHQGIIYGRTDQFWVTTNDDLESTADLADGGYAIYPVQPGFHARIATEQLLRSADLWEENEIINVPVERVPNAVVNGDVDALSVVGTNGRQLAEWCRRLDERVGGRLRALPVEDEFQSAIDGAPNTISAEVSPYGFRRADLPETVAGWTLPMQWLFGPGVSPAASAEIVRVVHDHPDTLRQADALALERTEPAALTRAVMPEYPIHEGVADVFETLGVWDDAWEVGDAAASAE